jgi:hypothetical protein
LIIGSLARSVAAAAAALAVAGCAGSGYTYHSNRAEQLYFKVPDDWTVFDTADILEGEEVEGTWVRGFAAGDEPSTDAVFSIMANEPRGYVEVLHLGFMERDELSIATMRGTNFGTDMSGNPIDPLVFAQENPDGPLQILDYDDHVVLDHGPHGVHLRVAVTPDGSDTTAIIDQTVLVDSATQRRYVLSIGCDARCFEEHEHEIEEVIDSWTLESS